MFWLAAVVLLLFLIGHRNRMTRMTKFHKGQTVEVLRQWSANRAPCWGEATIVGPVVKDAIITKRTILGCGSTRIVWASLHRRRCRSHPSDAWARVAGRSNNG
jgi:hypothetical protein